MPARVHGPSVRLDIIAVGMLLASLGFVVFLFAIADVPPDQRLFTGPHRTLDLALCGLGCSLIVTGLGIVFEAPWAWLPGILFCGFLAAINPWATLTLAYIPWILLQPETRDLFLHNSRGTLRWGLDVGLSLLLAVVLGASMMVVRLAS